MGGNGFDVRVRGGVRKGGEGGGFSDILQDMQMDLSPLYASQGFVRGGGSELKIVYPLIVLMLGDYIPLKISSSIPLIYDHY